MESFLTDRQTLHLLGERTVLLKDGPWGRAGDEVASVAVLARAVVDTPGRVPTAASPDA
ncbi:hypothetical protein [Kitasatospora sp. NPDC059571]|uniref:hypothetical protein n=1 Tax=Kitasatospora sp. NPDC059571 TaxID=3346871 RepID=UPI0036B080CB